MRYLSSSLLAAQRTSGRPATYLTVGGDDYADKLERLRHIERPYGGRATILLGNSDKSITTDHRGDKVVIGYGFVGVGDSKAAPLWVLTQQDVSYEGEVAVQLVCIDIWLKLSLTRIIGGGGTQLKGTMVGVFQPGMKVTGQTSGASGTVIYSGEGYIAVANVARTFQVWETVKSDLYPDTKIVLSSVSDFGGGSAPAWNGDKTILEIIQQLTSGIVTVVLDSSDGKVDSYKPHFETEVGARVLDIIQDLMGKTTCGIRMENDGNLHVFSMSAPGTDYTYDTAHSFFSNLRDTSSILPNRIIVINAMPTATGVTTYTGSAEDAAAKARFGIWITQVIIANVQSDAEAGEVASSMLTRVQREATRGSVEVPMNCGQELFDYIRVDDNRADIDYHGWVGSLEHIQEPGVYRLIVGLGGLTGGERIAEEEEYPLPNIVPAIVPPPSQVLPVGYTPITQGAYIADVKFSSDDYNEISWQAGNIRFADGRVQPILAGSLTLTAMHYLYCIWGNSTLQNSTSSSDATGTDRVLVAVASKASTTAQKAYVLNPFTDSILINTDKVMDELVTELKLADEAVATAKLQDYCIVAGKIQTNAVTAAKIKAGAVTAIKIDVNTLDAISANVGTLTSGIINGVIIYAGNGNVTLDANGIKIKGEYLKFYYGSSYNGYLKASSGKLWVVARPGSDLVLDGDEIHSNAIIRAMGIKGYSHENYACGYSNMAWSQVVGYRVFSEDGAIHSYQKQDDIALLKAIKDKVGKDGKHAIDGKTLPQDLVEVNEQGQSYVNLGGLSGLSIGIMKSLLARIEALEAKK